MPSGVVINTTRSNNAPGSRGHPPVTSSSPPPRPKPHRIVPQVRPLLKFMYTPAQYESFSTRPSQCTYSDATELGKRSLIVLQ